MKSTILCLSIVSVWLLVMRNEMSYPCTLVNHRYSWHSCTRAFTGFLRSTKKLSALCIMNRVNL